MQNVNNSTNSVNNYFEPVSKIISVSCGVIVGIALNILGFSNPVAACTGLLVATIGLALVWYKGKKSSLQSKTQQNALPLINKTAGSQSIAATSDVNKTKIAKILKDIQVKFPFFADEIKELQKFLSDDVYKYDKNRVDFGFEQYCGVPWIDPKIPADLKFLQTMGQKYSKTIQAMRNSEQMMHEHRNHLYCDKNQGTRFANSDIIGLFMLSEQSLQSQNNLDYQNLIKETMIYILLRDFPN